MPPLAAIGAHNRGHTILILSMCCNPSNTNLALYRLLGDGGRMPQSWLVKMDSFKTFELSPPSAQSPNKMHWIPRWHLNCEACFWKKTSTNHFQKILTWPSANAPHQVCPHFLFGGANEFFPMLRWLPSLLCQGFFCAFFRLKFRMWAVIPPV